MLYGAIIGDMAGSVYEFNNIKYKPLCLLPEGVFFTDDTVMTIAVAEAVMTDTLNHLSGRMRAWAKRFPGRGYGGMFTKWIYDESIGAYNSFGNGSAMRVSAAGWAGKTEEEVRDLARRTAEVTHNHPEGIKGAEAVAVAIHMARIGYSKWDIMNYMKSEFGYSRKSCDEIRLTYEFNETCQRTVPEALQAFYESDNFEDAIKLAISLGGDSDTLAAITGSVAEAYYGVPPRLIREANRLLPTVMKRVINKFEHKYSI